jgi:maltooligosyltrehalose trehalohydrolase
VTWQPTLGAISGDPGEGTHFLVWAPEAHHVDLVLDAPAQRLVAMDRIDDGYFRIGVPDAGPGTLYRYRVNDGDPRPDPASRYQPMGVHGPSQVIDSRAFDWDDAAWHGGGQANLVLYELHVGTFTPEGTLRAASTRLPYLVDLGVTAVELMPVADFPGRRNWGYDGVAPFAPARCYGTPDDLRRFVDTAHRAGLAVHLDVVYNHFGPDGAYQGVFSRQYHSDTHRSPWGQGINFDGPGSEHVRRYVIENALHWVHEYHVDGLRLDATHAIVDDSPVHIVAAIAAAVHESPRGRSHRVRVIAEDHRNLASMLQPAAAGGWALDAVWSDDLHHEVRTALTGDRDGYFVDFSGSEADIAATIRDGWFYRGQASVFFEGPRGTDPSGLPLSHFVAFIQNHDQVGNRALGERLHHDITPAAFRAASALLLVLPESPLLFMGQEWAASTPFRYFTDHHEELGRAVTAGRRREFRRFARFADPASAARIPDPQAEETFTTSRLHWDELEREPHAGMLRLHRRLLALRRDEPALQSDIAAGTTTLTDETDGVIAIRRDAPGARSLTALVRLRGAGARLVELVPPACGHWDVLFTTEDAAFATGGVAPRLNADGSAMRFDGPGAVVLASRGAP